MGKRVFRVLNDTQASLFRDLTPAEEPEYLDWARRHPDTEIRSIYHPVIQNELFLIREKKLKGRELPEEE